MGIDGYSPNKAFSLSDQWENSQWSQAWYLGNTHLYKRTIRVTKVRNVERITTHTCKGTVGSWKKQDNQLEITVSNDKITNI